MLRYGEEGFLTNHSKYVSILPIPVLETCPMEGRRNFTIPNLCLVEDDVPMLTCTRRGHQFEVRIIEKVGLAADDETGFSRR
jgi:hypothetical protein